MNNSSGKILIIFLIVVVILLVVGITTMFFISQDGDFDFSNLFSSGSDRGEAETVKIDAQELFDLFRDIESLKVDGEILNNQTFVNLVNFGTIPQSRSVGTPNPFSR